ncbi:MAG: glucose-6-phosphate isomerase [Chitinivibrionales bacterium]
MNRIQYDTLSLKSFVSEDEFDSHSKAVEQSIDMLAQKNGPGNDFLGWHKLPSETNKKEISGIKERAEKIRSESDVLICIGIGGSYLGAKAAIEFLSPTFNELRSTKVIFAGHHINSDYLNDLISLISDKDVSLNVISKSGTTTEPGITFRVLRDWMEKRYGKKGAAERITATTDPEKGALRKLSQEEGYSTFPIAGDVGGRFSVLTPVGLLPIAAAGIEIERMIQGAETGEKLYSKKDLRDNPAAEYAAVRNILFRRGKNIEMLAGFNPYFHYINEWWKQLAGESEGKNLTGIFPAAADYTTDLHSLGQWMQEGLRSVFETFLVLEKTQTSLPVPEFSDNNDNLNYLAGTSFEDVNEKAFKGTLMAHIDGGVPASVIRVKERSPESLGQLFYFFEKAVAVSGYLLKVNPFNQPGVEAYKRNMFALLKKPGFEELSTTLKKSMERMGV